MMSTAGILLTGGRSRRMGVDKAQLAVDGESLAARAARVLVAMCDPVVEVGDGHSGLPHVRESPSGSGPLAALAAGGTALRALMHHGPALLLAVDLPRVDEGLLQWLRDRPGAPTAVPEVDGRLQPVCARYGPDALIAADSLVTGGIRALRALFDVVDHDVITESEWRLVAAVDAFTDIDTPADAARFGIVLPD